MDLHRSVCRRKKYRTWSVRTICDKAGINPKLKRVLFKTKQKKERQKIETVAQFVFLFAVRV